MKMVKEWTACGWQVLELDGEFDADSIGVCGGRDGAFDVAFRVGRIEEWLVWESSCVDFSNGVVLNNGRVSTNASDGLGGGLGAGEGEERSREDRDDGRGVHLELFLFVYPENELYHFQKKTKMREYEKIVEVQSKVERRGNMLLLKRALGKKMRGLCSNFGKVIDVK